MRPLLISTAVVVVAVLAGFALGAEPAPKAVAPSAPAKPDTLSARRDSLVNVVLKSIAGHEDAPAESVFKNIKILKGMPAKRVLAIMNMGFSKSIGEGCEHCHVLGQWDKEDKPGKKVTREMWAMTQAINTEYLAKIENLSDENPTVNCTTCHRGALVPALTLPAH
jgi:hypothetical protein